jgi:Fic family protein
VKRSQMDIAGRYSPAPRIVAGASTVFPHPLKVPELMEEFGREISKVSPTPSAAFEAHFRLTNIHPFADGNGRTARLLMNLILVRGGYRPVAVRPVDRSEYLDALESASNKGNLQPFQTLMHKRLADTMSDYVSLLRETHENQAALEAGKDAGQAGKTPASRAALLHHMRGADRGG